ncbi:hypothetical protein [Enterococcus italicus]|uniref:hypothetical protein n=1 Tax=Enterococcus italicus TaxID=246144 RepID=UPI0028AB822C|nr:hypothetical protein [Enterococcus italicus]
MKLEAHLEIALSRITRRTQEDELRFSLFGCAVVFFLSKDYFPNNKEIEFFINGFHLYPDDKGPYKKYIYASRTLLVARVIRDIYTTDRKKLDRYLNAIKAVVFSDSYAHTETQEKKSKENYFDDLFEQFGGSDFEKK